MSFRQFSLKSNKTLKPIFQLEMNEYRFLVMTLTVFYREVVASPAGLVMTKLGFFDQEVAASRSVFVVTNPW